MEVIRGGLSATDRLVSAVLASGFLVILGVGLAMPAEGNLPTSCLFRELTGLSCLTCGLTRSLQASAHAHLLTAFQFHLAGPFLFAGIVGGFVTCAAEASTGKRLSFFRLVGRKKSALVAFLAVWLVYGLARMATEFLQ